MYTLYERVEKDSDLSTFYDNIEKLASSVGVNPKAIVEEIATLFVSSGSVCIFELFTSKSLENHQSVRQLCEFNILVDRENFAVYKNFPGSIHKAMDQKERFEKESRGQSVLAETTSANVIDQMF